MTACYHDGRKDRFAVCAEEGAAAAAVEYRRYSMSTPSPFHEHLPAAVPALDNNNNKLLPRRKPAIATQASREDRFAVRAAVRYRRCYHYATASRSQRLIRCAEPLQLLLLPL